MITVNFKKMKYYSKPLPEGVYIVEIINVELKTSKKSLSHYLNWHLKIIDDDEHIDGKRLFLVTSLKETCLWRLKMLLKALKYPCNGDLAHIDPENIIGRELKVTVT
ncbi:MAG: hypothetical protein A2Y62_04375 [Candidatus Fischerbacteria bacterium RBG_13_37_8]|uniref:DUF669 domain-containing protein n=1 Tax=Candidatus Fischerbacteria bacterium RBG_13_37_8 TaxID=1817863 RepID=A0A1F5VXJ1_9BACT|nr:MAG: hypothetical protein A2Y62_04375 [Candidatus Fischerbacteria bacterium RBG_13_37_8]